MKVIPFIILICLIFTPLTYAGNEVSESWIIKALESMEKSGLIEIPHEEPLTRYIVADLIVSLSDKWEELTLEQKSFLMALEREFASEIALIWEEKLAQTDGFRAGAVENALKAGGYSFIYREDFKNMLSIRDLMTDWSSEDVTVREVSFDVKFTEGALNLRGEGFRNPTVIDYLLRGAAIFNAGYRFLDDEETREITGGLASMGLDYLISPNDETKIMATMALEKGYGQADTNIRLSTSAGLEYSFAERAVIKADYTIDENILDSTTILTSLEFGYSFSQDTSLSIGYRMVDFTGYEGSQDDYKANLASAEFMIKF